MLVTITVCRVKKEISHRDCILHIVTIVTCDKLVSLLMSWLQVLYCFLSYFESDLLLNLFF